MKMLLKLWLLPMAITLLMPAVLLSVFGEDKWLNDIVEMFES